MRDLILENIVNNIYNPIGNILVEMAFGRGKDSQPITRQQFTDLIRSAKETAKPISITSITQPTFRKRQAPFKKLYKVSQLNGFINFEYPDSVNRQRGREDKPQDFVAQGNWGEHDTRSVIELKGKYYIQIKVESARSPVFIYNAGSGFKTISKDEVSEYMSPSVRSSTQQTDKEIVIRRYAIDSIAGFKFNNQEFYISDLDLDQQAVLDLANPPGE
jgi:hypothetical protein